MRFFPLLLLVGACSSAPSSDPIPLEPPPGGKGDATGSFDVPFAIDPDNQPGQGFSVDCNVYIECDLQLDFSYMADDTIGEYPRYVATVQIQRAGTGYPVVDTVDLIDSGSGIPPVHLSWENPKERFLVEVSRNYWPDGFDWLPMTVHVKWW
jgi:hypothetical protein